MTNLRLNPTKTTRVQYSPRQRCSACHKHQQLSANQKLDYSSQSGRPTIFDRVQQHNLSAAPVGHVTLNSSNTESCDPLCSCCGGSIHNNCEKNCDRVKCDGSIQCSGSVKDHWRPLLLIIPLRLGLTDINPVYNGALKVITRPYLKKKLVLFILCTILFLIKLLWHLISPYVKATLWCNSAKMMNQFQYPGTEKRSSTAENSSRR